MSTAKGDLSANGPFGIEASSLFHYIIQLNGYSHLGFDVVLVMITFVTQGGAIDTRSRIGHQGAVARKLDERVQRDHADKNGLDLGSPLTCCVYGLHPLFTPTVYVCTLLAPSQFSFG